MNEPISMPIYETDPAVLDALDSMVQVAERLNVRAWISPETRDAWVVALTNARAVLVANGRRR